MTYAYRKSAKFVENPQQSVLVVGHVVVIDDDDKVFKSK